MTYDKNHCDVSGNFYTVVYKCKECGKSYARHLGTEGLCKECLTKLRKIDYNAIVVKPIAFILLCLLAIYTFIIPTMGNSYDWSRPSGITITNINNSNNTFITFNNTYINVTNETIVNVTMIPIENIFLSQVGTVIRINSTRTIQTFNANALGDVDSAEDQSWSTHFWNMSTHPTVKSAPKFGYDFNLGAMNDSYTYWNLPWTCSGANCPYGALGAGFVFRREKSATHADVTIRFKASGGSIIGFPCPDANNEPTGFWGNVSIIVNTPRSANISTKLFTINSTMYNWTTLTFYNVSLRPNLATILPDDDNWRVSIMAKTKQPTLSIPQQACFSLESITVEQYSTR